jgi:SAM-dependent methyltransferase
MGNFCMGVEILYDKSHSSYRYLHKTLKLSFQILRNVKETILWNYRYYSLREPKVKSWVPHDDPDILNAITEELEANNFNIIDLEINITEYKQYMRNAEYHKVPDYYKARNAKNFIEKSLEHYLAAKLLDLSKDDIYIDIASGNSPTSGIYQKLYGCKAYRQDLAFPKGIHGNTIGGDASNMPIEDDFCTKMALHCSFEHFEGNSDIKFIKEASRVLRKGGKLCILPFYLFTKYAIQTDPIVLPKSGINFEREATLYCARGYVNRHGRFYDIPHLIERIRKNLNNLRLTFYIVQNEKEVDASCYVKFIALFEK